MALLFVLLQKLLEVVDGLFLGDRVQPIVVCGQVQFLLVVVHAQRCLFLEDVLALVERKEDEDGGDYQSHPVEDEVETCTVVLEVHEVELPQGEGNGGAFENEGQHGVHGA
jgi:hypothetical protein